MDLPVLVAKWRSDQRASTTILLCSALTECGEGEREKPADYEALVGELARVASNLFASDVNVLVAACKMLLAAEELLEAQRVGLLAAKTAPADPRPFRLLGEVMLRRGDAERATRALERAIEGGANDAQTMAWVERARAYLPMQRKRGPDAVAQDLKWTLSALGGRPSGLPRSSAPPVEPTPPPAGASGPRLGSGPRRSNTVVGLGAVQPVAPGVSTTKQTLTGMPAVREPVSSMPPAAELDAEGKPFSNRLFVRGPSAPPSDRRPGAAPTAEPRGAGESKPPSDGGAEPARSSERAAAPRPSGPGGTSGARPSDAPTRVAAAPAPEVLAPTPLAPTALESEATPLVPAAAGEALGPTRVAETVEHPHAKRAADRVGEPAPPVAAAAVEGEEAWFGGLRRITRRSLVPPSPAPPEVAAKGADVAKGAELAKGAEVAKGAELAKGDAPATTTPADAAAGAPAEPAATADAGPSTAAPTAPSASDDAPVRPAPAPADVTASSPEPARAATPAAEPSSPAAAARAPEAPAKPTLAEPWPVAPAPSVELVPARASAPVRASDPPRPHVAVTPIAAPFVTGRPRWTKKRRTIFGVLVAIVLAEAIGAVALYAGHRKSQDDARQARELCAIADAVLHRGGPRAVAEAEATIGRARALAPSVAEVARVELRERVLSVIDADAATLPALEEAIARAERSKLAPRELAFARLVAAVVRGDRAASDAILAQASGAQDGWLELAAGVALEARGAAEAARRYERAAELEPTLFSARIRLARALCVSGELEAARARVAALATAYPQRVEISVLQAQLRAKGGGAAPTERVPLDRASVVELPRPLRTMGLLFVVPKAVDPIADAWRTAAAVDAADAPALAVLAGEAALEAGDAVLAQKAVDRALGVAPALAAARSLAARVALASGRLDDARKNLDAIGPSTAREVRGLAAYEAGDLAGLLAEAGEAAPRSITQARDRLRATRPYDRAKLEALRRSDAAWSDVVAVDAALDAGELAFAREVVKVWGDVKGHPTRAARAARLARYEGRADDARALLEGQGGHAALLEAALLAADAKEARAKVLAALDERYEPERKYLHLYLRTRHAGPDEGRALLAKIADPPPGAPLSVRAVAALAVAEIQDGPRVDAILTPLLKTWFRNPDVVRAGMVVGLLGKDALKKLQAAP